MSARHPHFASLVREDWERLMIIEGRPGRPLWPWRLLSPRFLPVVLIRIANALYRKRLGPLAKIASLVNFLIFGIEVPARLTIGGGLVLPHTIGTVLGARSIGSNVTIFHQVTIGATTADFAYDPETRPLIEDGVTIGVGAKVLGNIVLGKNCTIGANAVVLQTVPAGATAVGIPARIAGAYTP